MIVGEIVRGPRANLWLFWCFACFLYGLFCMVICITHARLINLPFGTLNLVFKCINMLIIRVWADLSQEGVREAESSQDDILEPFSTLTSS